MIPMCSWWIALQLHFYICPYFIISYKFNRVFAMGLSGKTACKNIIMNYGRLLLLLLYHHCGTSILFCSWWKGLFLDDPNSPLAGFEIYHDTAHSLGKALDDVMSSKTVKLVSFANIMTSWELLGRGSFRKYSKVPARTHLLLSK